MTTPRICKKVQYIPTSGNPIFEIFEEVEIGGRIVSLDPRNPTAEELQDADEAFAASQQARIAELESHLSAMTAERDSLVTDKATLTTERDSLQSQVTELTNSRDGLQAQANDLAEQVAQLVQENVSLQGQLDAAIARITELTAIAEQPVATLSQIRVWLLQNLGVNAIAQVNAMIEAIPDELQRAIAFQQWEYANNVLRDNPFLLLIAQQLNMTREQMDEAYLAATRIE